jgi:hypothetical protein
MSLDKYSAARKSIASDQYWVKTRSPRNISVVTKITFAESSILFIQVCRVIAELFSISYVCIPGSSRHLP